MTNKASQFYFRKSTHCIKENTQLHQGISKQMYYIREGGGGGSYIIFMVAFKIYHKAAIFFFSITYKV